MTQLKDDANEIMNAIIEYICRVYEVDYYGLADMIGENRGWFTRYRNAEFGKKGAGTTFKLINLAASTSPKQLIDVLFDE